MCRMLAKSCKICCNKGVKTDKRLAVFAVGLRVERGLNIRNRRGTDEGGVWVGLRVERGLNIHTKVAQR